MVIICAHSVPDAALSILSLADVFFRTDHLPHTHTHVLSSVSCMLNSSVHDGHVKRRKNVIQVYNYYYYYAPCNTVKKKQKPFGVPIF